MNTPYQMPRLKGFRFAREIIAYAVCVNWNEPLGLDHGTRKN